MSETFSHGRRIVKAKPMNFSELIFALYRSDDIAFDADGNYELTTKAMIEIQNHIWPVTLFNFWLEDTVAFKAIKATHKASTQKPVLRLANVTESSQLKQGIFNDHFANYKAH